MENASGCTYQQTDFQFSFSHTWLLLPALVTLRTVTSSRHECTNHLVAPVCRMNLSASEIEGNYTFASSEMPLERSLLTRRKLPFAFLRLGPLQTGLRCLVNGGPLQVTGKTTWTNRDRDAPWGLFSPRKLRRKRSFALKIMI